MTNTAIVPAAAGAELIVLWRQDSETMRVDRYPIVGWQVNGGAAKPITIDTYHQNAECDPKLCLVELSDGSFREVHTDGCSENFASIEEAMEELNRDPCAFMARAEARARWR